MCHSDAFERFGGSLLSLSRTHSAISQWKLNIFIDCQVADQVEALEDESNFAIANAGAFRHRKVFNRVLVQHVLTFGWGVEQTEDREKRGFTAASGSRY